MDNKEKNRAEELNELKVYTLTELEPIIGVTHRTLQSYVLTGKLKAKKIGGKWRVTRAALEEFINGDS
jgi:excisionase family DNA binding protein